LFPNRTTDTIAFHYLSLKSSEEPTVGAPFVISNGDNSPDADSIDVENKLIKEEENMELNIIAGRCCPQDG
jgi:hypothetical protein